MEGTRIVKFYSFYGNAWEIEVIILVWEMASKMHSPMLICISQV